MDDARYRNILTVRFAMLRACRVVNLPETDTIGKRPVTTPRDTSDKPPRNVPPLDPSHPVYAVPGRKISHQTCSAFQPNPGDTQNFLYPFPHTDLQSSGPAKMHFFSHQTRSFAQL